MADAPVIEIRPVDEETARLWQKVAELAREFGVDQEWTLVGGLMVQLHAYQRGASPRPTTDIDVLADARRRPTVVSRIARVIKELGGELPTPPRTNPNLGYRFEIDGQIVDLLGPDGLKKRPRTVGKFETFEIPGGSQALNRTETVAISVEGGPSTPIRRPTLLGAILLKARSLMVHRRREDQRQDLILLLGFVEDPRATAAELSGNERRWLKNARRVSSLMIRNCWIASPRSRSVSHVSRSRFCRRLTNDARGRLSEQDSPAGLGWLADV